MTANAFVFNPPPGWPVPSADWVPPEGWTPDPSWTPAPANWVFWVLATDSSEETPLPSAGVQIPPPAPPPPPPPPPRPSPLVAVGPSAIPAAEATAQSGDALRAELQAAGTELQALRSQVNELQAQLARQAASPTGVTSGEVVDLDDERVLQEVGIYRYHHPLENSEEYRGQLRTLEEAIKDSVKRGDAVLASDMFTFNNSLAKGRKMTADFSKLMLRAYNAEADNCVRSLRAGNVVTAKKRLEASIAAIAKLGSMMEMRINPVYHQFRVQELELTSDFLMKVQEEKEAAREERERLREERKAAEELAAERERLDKERNHYANALEALKASGDETGIAQLTKKLGDIDQAIAQNDYRIANIRAGYVYVISNAGAFGPDMVKIGMTRRLEPMDRVRELGDASVPFPFDVHALFFSDDAVALETDLHQVFASKRVNHVNLRREFYFASPAEVHAVLSERVGNLLEFTEEPEATQYRQSKGYWPTPN